MNKNTRPDLFKNPKVTLDNLARNLTQDIMTETASKASEQGLRATVMPNYLQVTEERLAKKGVVDLKPYFARSSKKKYNKQGQWYMYIPIRVKTRDMSSRLYKDLREVPMSGMSSKTVTSDYLYDRRKQSPSVSSINYTPKSNNITKQRNNNKNIYVAYRTVNAKSPSSSWIVNRSKVDDNDMSKTMIKNVDRLMQWKMKNL